ncbi:MULTISPECIES: ABC transporter ATP-binding protein [Roseobacteraceae]|uniref:Spermidine/putrescine import ATP-binding protein PotA n=1 Tax=Pseudosulfitobacter pseudonitzschiae TaxID=1402135 RepID=A0A221JXW8_9RHOB|nr:MULTISPECIES: ABC transporter ATP-binding protein [Roseobacteraceae]ASM71574.1 spermidine/putrescine import ATP-binding protein PotA [Pseudosulfitobacter pseudonitzschiae]
MTAKTGALPITVRDVTKTYGPVHALDGVSLNVKSGEFLTLLGPSGSGKTTLLMVLAGFTRPDRGSLKFGEDEMIRTPPHLRGVGMVFQNYALFPHMSVAGNVGYPLKLRNVPKAEAEDRINRALELVQLGGYGDRGIDQLSGGQKQRVALARSIVFEPRILLMDEPLSALDKKLRDRMQIELRHLHEQLGMTTVYVTHDQREALTMSDRIAVVNHGRIMQLADPQQLYDRPANKFVADFIGDSSFLPVTRDGAGISFVGATLQMEGAVPDGNDLLLMVRPERVRLLTGELPADTNIFDAKVTELVYQGESYLLYARLPDGSEIAVRGAIREGTFGKLPQVGDAVKLGLHKADTVVIVDGDR